MIQLVNAINFQNEMRYITNNVTRLEQNGYVKFLCREFLIEGQISECSFKRKQSEVMFNLHDIEISVRLFPSSYKVISDETERKRAGLPVLLR